MLVVSEHDLHDQTYVRLQQSHRTLRQTIVGSMNPKKIDLTQGTVFNWQGVGAAQFLLVVPVLGAPLALYGLGMLFWDELGAVLLIGVVGLIGLAGTRYWIQLLAMWLKKQRHEISNDFRNQ